MLILGEPEDIGWVLLSKGGQMTRPRPQRRGVPRFSRSVRSSKAWIAMARRPLTQAAPTTTSAL